MDFVGMANEHVLMKQQIGAFIRGRGMAKVAADMLRRDDHCELGRWLYANLERYQDNDEFLAIMYEHAELHSCAADVVECCDAGDVHSADALFREEVAPGVQKVVRALARISGQNSID